MSDKTEVKTIKGPKAAIASFVRKDGQRIWVFRRKGEADDAAIKRVMKHNGMEGGSYERCS